MLMAKARRLDLADCTSCGYGAHLMLVHQAVYGPSGGHAYLQGSDPSRDKLFRGVAWRTDLPYSSPCGSSLTPFFRLLKENEHFLFIFTRAAEGEERSGTVISRAAFIPASELEAVQDLRPIIRFRTGHWLRKQPHRSRD